MASSPIPPIDSIQGLSTAERASILDLLFEPSSQLHTLSVPLLQQQKFESYADLIAAVGVQLTELSESASTSDTAWLNDILGSHPRLGAKKVDSAQSQAEQAQLKGSQEETEQLRALNEAYEDRYPGLRYVVFVNGRSRPVIMEDMRDRIANSDLNTERLTAIRMQTMGISRFSLFTPAEIINLTLLASTTTSEFVKHMHDKTTFFKNLPAMSNHSTANLRSNRQAYQMSLSPQPIRLASTMSCHVSHTETFTTSQLYRMSEKNEKQRGSPSGMPATNRRNGDETTASNRSDLSKDWKWQAAQDRAFNSAADRADTMASRTELHQDAENTEDTKFEDIDLSDPFEDEDEASFKTLTHEDAPYSSYNSQADHPHKYREIEQDSLVGLRKEYREEQKKLTGKRYLENPDWDKPKKQ